MSNISSSAAISMLIRRTGLLILSLAVASAAGTTSFGQNVRSQSGAQSLQTPLDYFRRADDLTNIRMPGSAPFHMKVTFQALPGVDFAKPGKSDIITGNGTYEEWWRSPEQWRREVTLAGYHAIEVRADGVRKMQASSDYEPGRVLMLLDPLLAPVPRNLLEPQIYTKPLAWTIRPMTAGGLPFTRISAVQDGMNGQTYLYAYAFLPSGILIRADDSTSMMTSWDGFRLFSGKLVPGRIAVEAMNRYLLKAEIAIEPLSVSEPVVQLPGPDAPPGTTLRPLHWWEVKLRMLDNGYAGTGNVERYAIREIVDRTGKTREHEVLAAGDINFVKSVLPHVQHDQWMPPTVDGSPCEFATAVRY